jgi:uncharacterized protein YjiS (DUF1127 family)
MMWAETAPAWLSAMLGGAERSVPRRWPPPRQPAETEAARLARHAADRRHLARLEDRLLEDVGLDREAVARGLPFADPALLAALLPRNRSPRP